MTLDDVLREAMREHSDRDIPEIDSALLARDLEHHDRTQLAERIIVTGAGLFLVLMLGWQLTPNAAGGRHAVRTVQSSLDGGTPVSTTAPVLHERDDRAAVPPDESPRSTPAAPTTEPPAPTSPIEVSNTDLPTPTTITSGLATTPTTAPTVSPTSVAPTTTTTTATTTTTTTVPESSSVFTATVRELPESGMFEFSGTGTPGKPLTAVFGLLAPNVNGRVAANARWSMTIPLPALAIDAQARVFVLSNLTSEYVELRATRTH